jgi:gamma-glutamylcyclotransferase (GGCT)/AIG2-like uncharacterized protein YtfP
MSEYLFSYGTLQPGLAPDEIAPLVAQLVLVGRGFVRGVLYDFGPYPGAILDPHATSKVFGVVLKLPQNLEILPALDAYEEFDLSALERSEFVRTAHPVALESGGSLLSWIYVYNRDPGDAPVLHGGVFSMKTV